MENKGDQWHSDEELASALERSLDIDAASTGAIPVVPSHSDAGVEDLFAALIEDEKAEKPVTVDAPPAVIPEARHTSADVVSESDPVAQIGSSPESLVTAEGVFESLDDFKPRTNFVPVVSSESVVTEVTEVTVSSSQVTMPVDWKPDRPSFDEIVFGAVNQVP